MNVFKNRILPIAMCCIVLLSIPTFAFADNNTNVPVKLDNVHKSYGVIGQGFNDFQFSNSNYLQYDVYIAFCYFSDCRGAILFSLTPNATFQYRSYGDAQCASTSNTDPIIYYNSSMVYYNVLGSNYDPIRDTLAPSFYFTEYTMNEGIDTALSVLYNAANPTYPLINYSLPAGNVAYIEIGSNFDGFNLTCKFPENSSIVGPPWWNITSRWGFADSLPTSETNFNSFSLIEWAKADSGNLIGMTQNASFDPVGPFAQHTYLVIYNPLYYGGTDNGPYEWMDNPSINIAVQAISIKVYALNSSIGPGQSAGSAQVNTITEGYIKDGDIDENGNITWTENGEESTEPITGGSNTPGVASSIYSFLENIANQLTGFFQGAIGAVNTVVAAISNFVNSLKGLYMWLPGPVYSLLTSAIMIAITIGVIKVFI